MSTPVAAPSFDDYLAYLRADSRRFREVLADCDPAARVPACPDWDADDLLWHLGTVQHFWAQVISTRPSAPDDTEPARPEGRERLLAYFDDSSAALAAALEAADPAEPAWTWSSEQTVGFTFRRQALEALIHRLDAEQTADQAGDRSGGPITPLDPHLAADGVAEVIGVMFGGHPPWGHFEPAPQRLRFDLTDVGSEVWAQLGIFSGTDPDTGRTYADETDIGLIDPADVDPAVEPDVVISGTSGDILAWLWRRRDDAEITVDGDHDVYATFRGVVDNPID